jgi:hypothetical protein
MLPEEGALSGRNIRITVFSPDLATSTWSKTASTILTVVRGGGLNFSFPDSKARLRQIIRAIAVGIGSARPSGLKVCNDFSTNPPAVPAPG